MVVVVVVCVCVCGGRGLLYHYVGRISDLTQPVLLQLVTWRIKVMHPMTPSHWKGGHSWLQFDVGENGWKKCYWKMYYREGITKNHVKWYPVDKITLLSIELVFSENTWIHLHHVSMHRIVYLKIELKIPTEVRNLNRGHMSINA